MVCTLIEKDGVPDWCEECKMYHRGHYRTYALDAGEKGEKFRAYWRNASYIPPSFTEQAKNYFSARLRHKANGSLIVPENIRAYRRSFCEECEHRDKDKDSCKKCGCPLHATFLGDKLAWASESCPLKKWLEWKPLEEGTKLGVVIGCYNLPRLTELQIHLIRDHCGHVPILIADDTKPETQPAKDHEALAKTYPDVFYWPNPENYGHHRGDASAFWKGIQWGHSLGLRVVAKQSMRHLIDIPLWLQTGAKGLLDSGFAVGSQNCVDNGYQLFIRSESVLLDVKQWVESEAWRDLQGRNSYAPVVELHYNDIIHKCFGGKMYRWPILKIPRYEKTQGIVWHCANPESDYHALAKRYGITLDEHFHGDGVLSRKGFSEEYQKG